MAKTRSELREKAMVILYQIDILKSNKCEYNVENLINENYKMCRKNTQFPKIGENYGKTKILFS